MNALGAISVLIFLKTALIAASDINYRLPRTISPSQYSIVLTPYLDTNDERAFSFEGTLQFTFRVTVNDTNRIVLHAKDITLKSKPRLLSGNPNITVSWNRFYDFLIMDVDSFNLTTTATYTLSVDYFGIITDDMTAMYKSYYQEGNITRWMAATQLQPFYARKLFPCMDEPEFKTVFRLIIQCPGDYSCFSNSRSFINNQVNIHTFQPSAPMSTYQLSIIISRFVRGANITDFAVLNRPEAKSFAWYPFEIGLKTLQGIVTYTNISYWTMHTEKLIGMKLDHAALPDFPVEAIGHWGLISYRESDLLADGKQTTAEIKQRIAGLVARETSKMWFGNLVTCHWWSDLWLTEGFAGFFGYFAADTVTPSLHVEDHFVVSNLHRALLTDILPTSKPLSMQNVNSPSEILEQFSDSSSKKASAIIRMMYHFLGDETFSIGIYNYLSSKKYSAVRPEDLYNSLQEAANETGSIQEFSTTVKDVFDSWTLKSGYPLLYVWINHTSHTSYVRQERFSKEDDEVNNDIYTVPITFTSESEANFDITKPTHLLKDERMSLGPNNYEWVLLNIRQTGYYRVIYSNEIYGYLIRYMATDECHKIHEYNRAQLVDDAFNLAREGRMSFSNALGVVQFLEKEKSYTPWMAAYANINWLRTCFMHHDYLSSLFDMHVKNLMKNLINSLGFFTNGTEIVKILRTNTMKLACELKHEDCLKKSKELFNLWAVNKTEVPVDMREFVYCNGLRQGSATEFELLWDKYLDEQNANEKVLILKSLGCTNESTKINEILMETISNTSKIRYHDKLLTFNSALVGNKDNVPTVWDFIVQHIDTIHKIYGPENLKNMLDNVVKHMDEAQMDWFRAFINDASALSQSERESAKQSLEEARLNLRWVDKNENEIVEWITTKYDSGSTEIKPFKMFLLAAVMLLKFLQ